MILLKSCDFFDRDRVSPGGSGGRGASRPIALVASLALSHIAMAQVEFGYDPTLGTLPEAQCWTAVAEPGNPAPRVIGGVLVQGPTAAGPDQYWSRGDGSISFDSGFALETRIRVVFSDYSPDVGGLGRQRAGYVFQVIDSSGRVFGVWLGTDAILLQNNNMTDLEPAVPTMHMGVAGPVRTIRLEARNGLGRVIVDGT